MVFISRPILRNESQFLPFDSWASIIFEIIQVGFQSHFFLIDIQLLDVENDFLF